MKSLTATTVAEIAVATVMAKEMERGIAVATEKVKGTETDTVAAMEKAKDTEKGTAVATEKVKDTEADTAVATTRTNKPISRRAVCTHENCSAAIQPTQSSCPQAFVTKSKKERETICPMQLVHSIH